VAALVGIKPTIGLVSRSGIIPIAHSQDTAGPMARTVRDAAILLSAIAGATGLTLSRISRIVDAFEKRGLVERRTCPEDGRATNAWLTDAGLELAREAQAAHVADVQRVFFDVLSAADLEALAGAFARLGRGRALSEAA